MTNRSPVAIIHVQIVPNAGSFFASSNDLPGLHVAASSEEKLCDRVIQAIKFLFKTNRGMEVDVVPAVNVQSFPELTKPCDNFAVQRLAA